MKGSTETQQESLQTEKFGTAFEDLDRPRRDVCWTIGFATALLVTIAIGVYGYANRQATLWCMIILDAFSKKNSGWHVLV